MTYKPQSFNILGLLKYKTTSNKSLCLEKQCTKSIDDLKEREGPNLQAILKFIMDIFQVGNDAKVATMHLKQALKRCLANRNVINPKGTGVTGSFKLARPVKAENSKAVKKIPLLL